MMEPQGKKEKIGAYARRVKREQEMFNMIVLASQNNPAIHDLLEQTKILYLLSNPR